MPQVPFTEWPLRPEILAGLAAQNYIDPTPVQSEAFPLVMAGRDLLVQSRTGTGKTLAFGLPILERTESRKGPVSALVVLPTRELASQVALALGRLARPLGIEVAELVGGGSYRDQNRALNQGARIVVGTPGRLVDHIDKGSLKLGECNTLVLDEADEILDMGFAEELDKILAGLPKSRQSLLFSATMAPETKALAKKTLKDPQTLSLSSGLSSAPEIAHVAYESFRDHREDALVNVLHVEAPDLAIIFCHTKVETETLAERLQAEGFKASYLNGDLPQASRTRTLNAFRRRQIQLLVATDVAARGIDVKGVSHVFNLGVPHNPETYIHRVGRTGRAGASGQAVTFVPPRDAARFRRMLQSAGIQLEIKPLPQAEDVRKRWRERCHETLAKRIAVGIDDRLHTLAQELLAYLEPHELVAALLAGDELAKNALESGLDLVVPQQKGPARLSAPAARPRAAVDASSKPKAAKSDRPQRAEADGKEPYKSAGPKHETAKEDAYSREPRDLASHQEAGMARVYLNQGKAHQLAPGRLVQLICSSAGLKGDAIGAIAIHPHFCFFDIKESEAARVVDILNGLSARGKKMKANLVVD